MINWTVLIEAGVPFVGGLFATALGFGLVRLPGTSDLVNQKFFSHLKWLGPLVALFGSYLGWQSYQPVRSAQAEASALASKVSLPLRVDEITTLESIEGSGNTIRFQNSLAVTPGSPEERFRIESRFRQEIANLACNDAAIRGLLDAGYVVAWSYRLSDETEIAVAMNQKSCGLRSS